MEKNSLHANPELNLKDLSKHLELSPRRLSYLINTFLNQNFMGFVNDYRIKKAKYLLSNPKEKGETVLEVMYVVGFNSKSSFFTIFKQKTGVTPSEFKKRHTL
jgi:AraC-like DNA-binding protein